MGRNSKNPIGIKDKDMRNILLERYLLNGQSLETIASDLNLQYGIIKGKLVSLGIDKNPTNHSCDSCGKKIYVRGWDKKNRKTHFCGRTCADSYFISNCPVGESHWNYSQVDKKCAFCGIGLKVHKSRQKYQKTFCCSKECSIAYKKAASPKGHSHPQFSKKELKCMTCGILFLRAKYRAETALSCFCSKKCKNKFHMEHSYDNHYGFGWTSGRRETRKRDNGECQLCGAKEESLDRKLDIHHIVRFGLFSEPNQRAANHPSNLISYCRPCHGKIESETNSVLNRIDPLIAKALFDKPLFKPITQQSNA